MDPVGFALENYDAVGRWRTLEAGEPIDASGTLFDGTDFRGVAGLQNAILRRPELFITTLSEKLLIFAIGRGVDVLRRAGNAQDRARCERAGLPLFVDRHGRRQQHAVQDEEGIMMILEESLCPAGRFSEEWAPRLRCLCSTRWFRR